MQCVESKIRKEATTNVKKVKFLFLEKVFTGFYKPNLECKEKKGPGGPGTF